MASPAGRSAAARARARPRPAQVAAGARPVARVVVDVPLAHLDRPFDYLVPERLALAAVPGCRVRVRFAGRLTSGYLLARAEVSEHAGTLAFLDRVVSPEPVLTAEIAGLARAVADRYGGTLADVLRLAVPPRHARAEAAGRDSQCPASPPPAGQAPGPPVTGAGGSRRPAGPAALAQVPGPATRRDRRSSPRSPTAGRRGPSGRPCPAGLARQDRRGGGHRGGVRPRCADRRSRRPGPGRRRRRAYRR